MLTKVRDEQAQIISEAIDKLNENGFVALPLPTGYGKSRVNLGIFEQVGEKLMILISLKNLLPNIKLQVEEHWGEIPIFTYSSSKENLETFKSDLKQFLKLDMKRILFINIEYFQTKILEFIQTLIKEKLPFITVIDESSYIKNPGAERTKKVTSQFSSAGKKIIMTGSQFEKSPLDLYSQYEFLKTGFWPLSSFYWFKQEFATFKDVYAQGGVKRQVVNGFKNLERLKSIIDPFTIYPKSEREVPDLIMETVWVNLSKQERLTYQPLENDFLLRLREGEVKGYNFAIQVFTACRQVASGFFPEEGPIEKIPIKIQVLLDILEATEEQVIVWCNFNQEIDFIFSKISEKAARYHGGMRDSDKEFDLLSFTAGNRQIFIANPASAGVGFNFQFCHLQIWLQRPIRHFFFKQGIARSHGRGEKESCRVLTLAAKNTIDERLLEINEETQELINMFAKMKGSI